MRIQASLEFLLILSALSVLSLSVLALYSNSIKQTSSAFSNSISSPAQGIRQFGNATQEPSVIAYLPSNSTVGEYSALDIAFYGCNSGNGTAALYSNSIFFQGSGLVAASINPIGVSSVEFKPSLPGYDHAWIRYKETCGNTSSSGTSVLSTFASMPASQVSGGSGVSAYISGRNESIEYKLSGRSEVYKISMWNHCAGADFFGHIFPEQDQCGDGWDYLYSSGCEHGSVMCMNPSFTGYNMSSADLNNQTLVYNFSLLIGSSLGTIYGSMRNGSVSGLTIQGQPVGSAVVVQASGQSLSQEVYILDNSTSSKQANLSAYPAYSQSLASLIPELRYYNNTNIPGSIQSQISEQISAFNNYVSDLISPPQVPYGQQCSVSKGAYICRAAYPFSYEINASLPSIAAGSNSVYVDGSQINIIGA